MTPPSSMIRTTWAIERGWGSTGCTSKYFAMGGASHNTPWSAPRRPAPGTSGHVPLRGPPQAAVQCAQCLEPLSATCAHERRPLDVVEELTVEPHAPNLLVRHR